MEPMNLGSPGSPVPASGPYLPAFLMGEPQAPTSSRNTLSPKGNRSNVSFVTSPSSPDYNRSALGQKTLFAAYQQTPSPGMGGMSSYAGPGTPMQANNTSISGPPTKGLFDTLRSERNQIPTPSRSQQNASGCDFNQSYNQHPQYNESYTSNASFNASRAMLSPLVPMGNASTSAASYSMQGTPRGTWHSDFWITVYGFPPSAISTILQHFAQCGTIVDKIFPPQNGNWVHLKYSSRLECDRAFNYHEKILGNNIMIGVTHCKDKSIVDKENVNETVTECNRIRPLAQTAYRSAQQDSAVVVSPCTPQKSSGLVNKAMDLFFGW